MIRDTIYCDGDFEILTDVGWKDIQCVHKTFLHKKYLILFESGTEIECADKHVFIDEKYNEIFAKNLKSGDRLISEDGYDIIFDVFDTEEYEEFYDFTINNYSLYFSEGILSHNTNFLVNMSSRQVLEGYSPLILSLEMSEDALCQRFDSIYSLLDINKIYLHKSFTQKMIKSLKDIRSRDGIGNLIIKEFPTGKGTVGDFKAFIRELKYRGIFPNPIYCDYLQLVKNEISKNKRQDEDISEIASALRAMSLEMQVPVISVSQLNREGMFTSFDDIDFTYVAKGIDISAVADFMAIFGRDEDSLVYESELHYKIVKNRLGGRIGEIAKFFVDKRNLKMYDQTELDQWIRDAKISGDLRKAHKKG